MNYEETREQVDMILERVKALDNAKKDTAAPSV